MAKQRYFRLKYGLPSTRPEEGGARASKEKSTGFEFQLTNYPDLVKFITEVSQFACSS